MRNIYSLSVLVVVSLLLSSLRDRSGDGDPGGTAGNEGAPIDPSHDTVVYGTMVWDAAVTTDRFDDSWAVPGNQTKQKLAQPTE